MSIRDLVKNSSTLTYDNLCKALIEKFGVEQAVAWESVLPQSQQQALFGGEVLRLVADHPTLAGQKEIRPVCLMKGDVSQLLFFYVQLKDEKLPKSGIERLARKFIGGTAAERYIIWFFGNREAGALKIVISGKDGKKIRLKTLPLEAGQWFKTYDFILDEVTRRFDTGGLFQALKEPAELWQSLWAAFDIAIVNKKFYAEIKEVFDMLVKDELPRCRGVLQAEGERVTFAIRLIGRIIFCWFLKRKGIIADDALSAEAVSRCHNYYRELLEPLFFDVFNTPKNDRKKDLPDTITNYPFLNGGLFEPHAHDYRGNWALNIGNDWFTHFFRDTLETYNFTVDENSAASAEIAIDPEMLGRIFENLLAEQNPETGESARKSTGSYYTPREIVDFMVEESLTAYLKGRLHAETKGNKLSGIDEAIEDFVHAETIPDSLKTNSEAILLHLQNIKVLDPACGSGAFPMSFLQKLVALKQQLKPQASLYDLKLKTIERSIYGVDIQPMATELSRLRCWLSLIVDEDQKNIKPLPNLDFKFITANSLIDLRYDEFILKAQEKKSGGALFLSEFMEKIEALRAIRKKYFDSTANQNEKDKLKQDFNTIKDDLYRQSLELIKLKFVDAEFSNKMTGWNPFDDSEAAPFFNKTWMFGIEDGFDVVIANPPYVRQEGIKHLKPQLAGEFGKFYSGTADLYTYFYKKGLDVLKPGGHLCFISPNKFMRAAYGRNTRRLLTGLATPLIVMDFGDLPIFDATTYPAILLLEKRTPMEKDRIRAASFSASAQLERLDQTFTDIAFPMPVASLREEGWNLERSDVLALMEKLRSAGTPLGEYVKGRFYYGIKTGLNNAFVIDAATRERLIAEDPASAGLIKPWLRGRDIRKWRTQWAGLYVINIPSSINSKWPWSDAETEDEAKDRFKNAFPGIYGHLSQWEVKLQKRDDQGKFWWELRSCTYYEEFEQPKIIYPDIAQSSKFTWDNSKSFLGNTAYIIPTDELWLVGLLNSKLVWWFYLNISSIIRGGFVRFIAQYMGTIPIPLATDAQKAPLVERVQSILADPDSPDVPRLEREIDALIYQLYNLTLAEIAIVEAKG